jgi:hypothetical protein
MSSRRADRDRPPLNDRWDQALGCGTSGSRTSALVGNGVRPTTLATPRNRCGCPPRGYRECVPQARDSLHINRLVRAGVTPASHTRRDEEDGRRLRVTLRGPQGNVRQAGTHQQTRKSDPSSEAAASRVAFRTHRAKSHRGRHSSTGAARNGWKRLKWGRPTAREGRGGSMQMVSRQ